MAALEPNYFEPNPNDSIEDGEVDNHLEQK